QAERADAPADHRRAPPLAAVEVREPAEEVRVDARAVIVREKPVTRPGADGLAAGDVHAVDDAVQSFLPACAVPRPAPLSADHRVEQPPRVVEDLSGRLSTDAQETLAVRIFLVAAGADDPPILELDEHPAERRVAVHGAHRADNALHWKASLRAF